MIPLDHLFLNNTCTPLGLDRGTWGLGDIGRRWGDGDIGSREHNSIRSPIYKQHQHTFRVRHGDMGFRRHGSTRSPKSNTNTHLGFGCLLCHSTQLHHQSKLVSSSNIQNNVLAKMNRHLQCGKQQVSCSKITKYRACHEKVIVMIDPCHI